MINSGVVLLQSIWFNARS